MALYLTAIFSFPPQFGRRGWAFLGCLRCGCQGNTLADQGSCYRKHPLPANSKLQKPHSQGSLMLRLSSVCRFQHAPYLALRRGSLLKVSLGNVVHRSVGIA